MSIMAAITAASALGGLALKGYGAYQQSQALEEQEEARQEQLDLAKKKYKQQRKKLKKGTERDRQALTGDSGSSTILTSPGEDEDDSVLTKQTFGGQ